MSGVEKLTVRELMVAKCATARDSKGKFPLHKQFAFNLGVSVQTTKNHLHNIFNKLQVHSREELEIVLLGLCVKQCDECKGKGYIVVSQKQ